MKVVFTGTRDVESSDLFRQVVSAFEAKYGKITFAVCGGYKRGVDGLAFNWAMCEREIPCLVWPAQWKTIGDKSAGPIRNHEMVDFGLSIGARYCIGIWDQKSSGTRDCMKWALKRNLPVFRVNIGGNHEKPYARYSVLGMSLVDHPGGDSASEDAPGLDFGKGPGKSD